MDSQIRQALLVVQRILDTTRSPKLAKDHDHSYHDKYELATILTNTAIASLFNVLERMGLTEAHLKQMVNLVHIHKTTVTLRFELEHDCKFLHEKIVEVALDKDDVVSVKGLGHEAIFSRQVIKKVKEFHWEEVYTYKILVYTGIEPNDSSMCFQNRTGKTRVISRAKENSFQSEASTDPLDINLTWLIQQLQDGKCNFDIDRSDVDCRTPRRNKQIDDAMTFWNSLDSWSHNAFSKLCLLEKSLRHLHNPVVADNLHNNVPNLNSISSTDVFVPVLPLMEAVVRTHQEDDKVNNQGLVHLLDISSPGSPLLPLTDITKFLNKQCRSLDDAANRLTQSYNRGTEFITAAEAKCVLYCLHIRSIQKLWCYGVDYIEEMLHDQLVAAIGKNVDSHDFDQYITHHYRKMFSPQYAPKSFCYAIRQPNHYPDGILSIESMKEDGDPIQSFVRVVSNVPLMQIPINAATTIDMEGTVFLHGWLLPSFASSGTQEFKLVGRARQFSSFLMMVGNMASGDRFHPKDAIILQNKDEVIIPLLLRDIPTAKEFKEAVLSLSPEQQRFATSYREMQLESSVFGVCIVQLKPQLEVLLGLPEGSLTKEIKLTQDLMSLFVEYQIPSDLLSYDGLPTTATSEKIASVKAHVKGVLDVIETIRINEIAESKQKHLIDNPFPNHGRRQMLSMRSERQRGSVYSESFEQFNQPLQSLSLSGNAQCSIPSENFQCNHEDDYIMTNDMDEIPRMYTMDASTSVDIDFTAMPNKLNKTFDQYDEDNAVRTTAIETTDAWRKKCQKNILTTLHESNLTESDLKVEKNKAFDLLDALSRSGSLPLLAAELHVIIGVRHSFEETVLKTVIQRNRNPIEKMECSALIVAALIHNVGIPELVAGGAMTERLGTELPLLGIRDANDITVEDI